MFIVFYLCITFVLNYFGCTKNLPCDVQCFITIPQTMLIALISKGVKSGYFYWLYHSNEKCILWIYKDTCLWISMSTYMLHI